MTQRIATAEWANPEEFEKSHEFKQGDFWIGRSVTAKASPLGFNDDRHVCLVSGSRGGKGTTCIVNNLCLWPGSLIVIDPKGENATVTARRRGGGSEYCEGMGQDVHVLDPLGATQFEDSYKGSFNPLDELDPADPKTVGKAGRIADAIVQIKNLNDPSWENRGRSMVHALLLHVLTSPEYEGERNLLTVRKLLMRGDWKAVQAYKDMGHEEIPPSQHLLWNSVRCNTAFEMLPGLGERFLNTVIHAAEQYEGVIDAAVEATRFLDDSEMRNCLEKSTFKLAELKTNPKGVSVYLCLPQHSMNTHSAWLRMMIALTIYEMQARQDLPATGHRVMVCLDEFPVLKRMDIIEDNIAFIAGFGVKLFIILQSLEQLKGTYEKKWETFLSNCSLKIFFDVGEHFSREYIAKLIGETELIRETNTTSESLSESESSTLGQTRGTSRSDTVSKSHSASVSEGESQSNSKGRNWGGNRSHGWSTGDSDGFAYKPHPLIMRNTDRFFSLFRKDETNNVGHNSSRSGGGGKSWGKSTSETDGTSKTFGLNVSETRGSSTTENSSTSESATRGLSQSSSRGTSEQILKRALITADEIGRHFGRIDEPDDPKYPGFALVLIGGRDPIPIRRTNYFEEPELTALYDAHPQHPKTAPQKLMADRPLLAPPQETLDILQLARGVPLKISAWLTEPKSRVRQGQVLLAVTDIRAKDNLNLDLTDFDQDEKAYNRWFDHQSSAIGSVMYVSAPKDGIISNIVTHEGPIIAGQVLALLAVNRRTEYLESKILGSAPPRSFQFLGLAQHEQRLRLFDRLQIFAKQRAAQEAASEAARLADLEAKRLADEKKRMAREYLLHLEAEEKARNAPREAFIKVERPSLLIIWLPVGLGVIHLVCRAIDHYLLNGNSTWFELVVILTLLAATASVMGVACFFFYRLIVLPICNRVDWWTIQKMREKMRNRK